MVLDKEKEYGLALGVICPGTVPIKWMMHMQHTGQRMPGGIYWAYVYACGDFKKDPTKSYASLRTEVVEKALSMNSKWLMFVDSDVFIPEDCINRLMSHNKDIVTGIYWMKTQPPQPVVYKRIGDGPIWDIEPKDELEEIGGAGLGCCLIKLDVFRKFKEKGIDFFRQDWIHEKNGRRIQVSVGEDHWFFEKARELGFKVWMDSNVLCDHYDINSDSTYPDEKVVRKIAEKKLRKEGQGDLVDHQAMVRNIEKDKPTIVFYNANDVKFNGNSINEKPISGSETALIQMAKNFKLLGWNVHVFCNCDKEGYFENVGYHNYNKINDGMKSIAEEIGKEIDMFVSSRDIRPFLGGRPPVKKTILWMHDMPSGNDFQKPILKAEPYIDHFVFVSNYHKNCWKMAMENKLPLKKLFASRNGIDESRFLNPTNIQKRRGMCVYTTTPFRGLDVLMGIWPKIKEKVPFAELHVYSNMSIYNQKNAPDIERIFEYGKQIAKDNNIFFHNPVTQKQLANVLLEADVMVYPNHFPETSCITAMESIKAKTPIITSNFGALIETIKNYEGILIEGDSYREGYENEFIESTVKMLTDNNYRNSFCQAERDMSWKKIAEEWIKYLTTDNKKYVQCEIARTEDGKKNINTSDFWDKMHEYYDEENIGTRQGDDQRWEFISRLIPKHAEVMDIGCSKGDFLNYIYKKQIGSRLIGVEISEKAIAIAKRNCPLADFIQIDMNPIDVPEKNIDVIFSSHVIEHLDRPERYINCWKKSLKKDGEMILVIPLNDEPYDQHLQIYDLGRIEALAKSVAVDYEIKTRDQGWIYKETGRKAKEAIVRLWF
jgi:glycosyltransferase involved in cell wall biosynthesis/SAM-dependent methyltransferase